DLEWPLAPDGNDPDQLELDPFTALGLEADARLDPDLAHTVRGDLAEDTHAAHADVEQPARVGLIRAVPPPSHRQGVDDRDISAGRPAVGPHAESVAEGGEEGPARRVHDDSLLPVRPVRGATGAARSRPKGT